MALKSFHCATSLYQPCNPVYQPIAPQPSLFLKILHILNTFLKLMCIYCQTMSWDGM